MENVTLIDAGTGNLRSVQKALETLGARVTLTRDPAVLAAAERIVLPGVGAFAAFMDGLRACGLDSALHAAVTRRVPLLGICVGMQALFETGEEGGTFPGLGLLPGRVARFTDAPDRKVPHTGWNRLTPCRPSPLLEGLPEPPYAYFNHSYYCLPADPADALALTDYAPTFASAVQRGSIFGVQFHPEKSQSLGLALLNNFLTRIT
jgi:glutamine amidotransferase